MTATSISLPNPPRPQVVLALVRRDFHVARSYRLAFVLDLLFGFMNLIVFYFISRTFGDPTTSDLSGAPSYFAFAAVGIALTVVIGAATSGMSARIREEQLTGTLEALLVQPLSVLEAALGLAGFQYAFAMLRAAMYLAVAIIFLDLSVAHADWFGLVIVLLASGGALSAIGIALGAVVLVVKRGQSLVGVIMFGMGVLTGAVFPVVVLPDWMETLGRILPTRFAFDGLRAALFEGTGWAADSLALALYAVVGIPIAVGAFGAALQAGRRSGSLGQY